MNLGGLPRRSTGQFWRTRSRLAPMPPEVMITAWAAYSKSPASSRLDSAPRTMSSGASSLAAYAGDGAAVLDEVVDPVTELEGDQPLADRLPHPALERCDDSRTGPPGEVEARHRVAVTAGATVAALGPADHREHPQTLVVEPLPLLAGGEGDVRLGPAARPVVALAVELRAAHPVLEGELVGVLDAHPPLLGGVHEEEAAERPERLATRGSARAPGRAGAPSCRRRRARRWRRDRRGRLRRR